MLVNASLYFARYSSGGPLALLLSFIIWVPFHYLFKWIGAHYKSNLTRIVCIVTLTLITLGLVAYGTWLGNASGGYSDFLNAGNNGIVPLNSPKNYIGWLPFFFITAGIWMGFLSGYLRMPISEK